MVGNSLWDAEKHGSHAERVGAGESCAAATTRRVEGAPAAASADGDGPDLLGSTVEVVDGLAVFVAGGAAGNRGGLAPPRVQTLLGVEEPTPKRLSDDRDGAKRADSADQPRQSAVPSKKSSGAINLHSAD